MADGDGHVDVGDQVLDFDLLDRVHDLRAPLVAEILLDLAQFADDHLLQLFLARENFLQLGDLFPDYGEFLQNFVDREPGQAVQLQFEEGVDLGVAEADDIVGEPVLLAVELDAFERFRLLARQDDCTLLFWK